LESNVKEPKGSEVAEPGAFVAVSLVEG